MRRSALIQEGIKEEENEQIRTNTNSFSYLILFVSNELKIIIIFISSKVLIFL